VLQTSWQIQDYWVDLDILTPSSKHCLPAPSQDEDTPPTLLLPSSDSTDIGTAGLGRAKGVTSIALACNLSQYICIFFDECSLMGILRGCKLGVVLKKLLPARTSLSSCLSETHLRSLQCTIMSSPRLQPVARSSTLAEKQHQQAQYVGSIFFG